MKTQLKTTLIALAGIILLPLTASAASVNSAPSNANLFNLPDVSKSLSKQAKSLAYSRCVRWGKRCYRKRFCRGYRPTYSRCWRCSKVRIGYYGQRYVRWVRTCNAYTASSLRYRGFFCRGYSRYYGNRYYGARCYYRTYCRRVCTLRRYY